MSVTKIRIEGTGNSTANAKAAWVSQLSAEISPYGFTATNVNANIFYITANIAGLNTMYYCFYSSSIYTGTVELY